LASDWARVYSKEQIKEFVRFQDSQNQNTSRAFLPETAELAYLGRNGGEWGFGLTDLIMFVVG
jgi:hypothetical protein